MELIQIVDENGRFTGEIMDKEEAHDKNLLHNEVATFIINDNKQILLKKEVLIKDLILTNGLYVLVMLMPMKA